MLVNDVKVLKFNFQQMFMSKLRVLPIYNLIVSNFKLNLNTIMFTFYTQLLTYRNVLLDLKITLLCVIQYNNYTYNNYIYCMIYINTYIIIYYDSITRMLVFEYF